MTLMCAKLSRKPRNRMRPYNQDATRYLSSRSHVSKHANTYIYTIFGMREREYTGKAVKRSRVCTYLYVCVKQSRLFSLRNFPTLSMLCSCRCFEARSYTRRSRAFSAISPGQSINLNRSDEQPVKFRLGESGRELKNGARCASRCCHDYM